MQHTAAILAMRTVRTHLHQSIIHFRIIIGGSKVTRMLLKNGFTKHP